MWEINQKNKTLTVWFAVNKNGFVNMFLNTPVRNKESGVWTSNHYFINSEIYPQICTLVEKAKMNWDSEPEVIQFK